MYDINILIVNLNESEKPEQPKITFFIFLNNVSSDGLNPLFDFSKGFNAEIHSIHVIVLVRTRFIIVVVII